MVTPGEMLAALQRRERERAARAEQRAHRLRELLPQARDILVVGYGADQVWLFGSLNHGPPHEASDVDLAVRGLASTSYFAALADLMRLLRTPVDLVRLEEAVPSLIERVHAEGRLL